MTGNIVRKNFIVLDVIVVLPNELQSELNLACSSGSSGDHSSPRVIPPTVVDQTQSRQSKARVVGNVEELSTELRAHRLVDLGVLHKRKIECHTTRTGNGVATKRSIESEGRYREGAGV